MLKVPLLVQILAYSCTALPYVRSFSESATLNHLQNFDGSYNFDAHGQILKQFDAKYGQYLTSPDLVVVQAQVESDSLSEAEVAEQRKLYERSYYNSYEVIDTGTLKVGTQQLPFYFSLFDDQTIVPASTLPECIDAKSGYSLLANLKSKKLAVMTIMTKLLNSVNVEVPISIQGNTQLDVFDVGPNGIIGPIFAIFALVLNDQSTTIQCRVAFGLSPQTFSVTRIGTTAYVQPIRQFLAAGGGPSSIGLFVSAGNSAGSQYTSHVYMGGFDSTKLTGTLTAIPISTSKSITGKWALDGGSISVPTLTGLYTTLNQMGTLLLDNQNPFILLPSKIVDELHSKILGATKYGVKGSLIKNLWQFPCQLSPQISFHFIGVATSFTLKSSSTIVGPSSSSTQFCQSSIQYGNSDTGGVLGIPFLTSIYTMYQYNTAGTGVSISLAQSI